LIIKPIKTPEQINQVSVVESAAWGMKPSDTVPDHLLTAIINNGGLLLGAYDGDQLIGFTLGWLGTVDSTGSRLAADQLKLVSHMTGVLSGYRDQRIGYRLKLAQRDWALAQGLDLVTWTYDPIESRNSFLNIHLLGCTCQTYLRDYYGEMTDLMNEGITSDRFQVEWWIKDTSVHKRIAEEFEWEESVTIDQLVIEGVQLINPPEWKSGSVPLPGEPLMEPSSPRVLVEIPTDFQAIRKENLESAVAWRFHTRMIFESLFVSEYQVVDFIYQRGDIPRGFYLLEIQTL
jgi:predicted GNAT superfamily acetyltransferase